MLGEINRVGYEWAEAKDGFCFVALTLEDYFYLAHLG